MLEKVDVDGLEFFAKQEHPLTFESAGIPAEYCIVPQRGVLALIAELRASRKVVDAARMFPISVDQYNSGANEPLDGALAEYDELVNVMGSSTEGVEAGRAGEVHQHSATSDGSPSVEVSDG